MPEPMKLYHKIVLKWKKKIKGNSISSKTIQTNQRGENLPTPFKIPKTEKGTTKRTVYQYS